MVLTKVSLLIKYITLFVKSSYGGSWDSSSEKSRDLVQNHQVPVKTQWVSGSFVTTQLIWKQTVLNLTETKIYSLYCKAQEWLKEKTSFNNSHRNHTNRTFNKNIFRSSAALVGWRDLSGIGMRAVPFSVAHRHVFFNAQRRLKEKASSNNSHKTSHRNHTNTIFYKNIFRSSAALVGWRDLSGIGMRAVPFSVAHRHVFFNAQRRLKEKASSNNSHKTSHRNHTNTIFYKNIFRSSAALVGWRDLGGIGMRQSLLLSHTDMIFFCF